MVFSEQVDHFTVKFVSCGLCFLNKWTIHFTVKFCQLWSVFSDQVLYGLSAGQEEPLWCQTEKEHDLQIDCGGDLPIGCGERDL